MPNTPGWKKNKLQAQLTKINAQIKKTNLSIHNCMDSNEYQQMKIFFKNKYGDKALNDFYAYLNNKNETVSK